jgi:spore coat polysaccharide biosynthesis protein SpsF
MLVGVIIQARMTSSRLPGKVLLKLPYGSKISALEQVIRRAKKLTRIDEILIATTTNKNDDPLLALAEKEKVNTFRGSEDDVLSRYYLAAKEHKYDIVVRITSDCPCIDWEVIDEMIRQHLQEANDYTSNTLRRTFPHGLDCEVFNFSALEEAYHQAKFNYEREHVTTYIYKTNPQKFKIGEFSYLEYELKKEIIDRIRITLDTKEDYALLCAVYDCLYAENPFFKMNDIINLFQTKPWLSFINERIIQKKIFDSLESELEEAKKILKLQDLNRVVKILNEMK